MNFIAHVERAMGRQPQTTERAAESQRRDEAEQRNVDAYQRVTEELHKLKQTMGASATQRTA